MKLGWFERWLDETRFLERYPNYAGVLSRMDPIATKIVTTMAVAMRRWDDPEGRIQLLVNRRYFEEEHPEHRAGILLHEIQHIVLGHLHNPKFHYVGHPKLMEIAMELSANEHVDRAEVPGGIHIEDFERFGIAPLQSTMERYAILAEAYECGELDMMMDCWSASSMLDVHRPGRSGASGIGDFLDARSDRATARNWNRSSRHAWGLGAPTHARELERMKAAIQAHLQGEKGGDAEHFIRGRHHRVVAKEIDRVILHSRFHQRPALDWRRVLREAFPRRRLVEPDYKKPNRRFADRIGEIPGRTRRPPRPTLLVGIDTSGSMSSDSLADIAREVMELGRHARVTIVESDAAVHRVYPLTSKSTLGPFVGGGDTDFHPVFEVASSKLGAFEGVVYFTDGRGETPQSSNLPALWVISHADPFFAPFGTVVRMPVSY